METVNEESSSTWNEGNTMKFELEIDMDNAAFEESDQEEVCRILLDVVSKIWGDKYDPNEDGVGLPVGSKDTIRDSNGNTVGVFRVTE